MYNQAPQQPADSNENSNSGQPLADLVDALQSVDMSKPEASLNATSIDDNNQQNQQNQQPAQNLADNQVVGSNGEVIDLGQTSEDSINK